MQCKQTNLIVNKLNFDLNLIFFFVEFGLFCLPTNYLTSWMIDDDGE